MGKAPIKTTKPRPATDTTMAKPTQAQGVNGSAQRVGTMEGHKYLHTPGGHNAR